MIPPSTPNTGFPTRPAALPISLGHLNPAHIDPGRAVENYSQWVTHSTPAWQMEQQGMPPSGIVRYNPLYGNPMAYFQDRKADSVPPLVNPQLLDWNTYRRYYGF